MSFKNLGLPKKSRRSSGGWTLLELMAVMVIIAIIIAVAAPLMKGPSRALQIGSSAEILKGELLLARQQAMTLNGAVEIRFFQKTAADPYTAYQIFNIEPDNTVTVFSKLRNLPQGLVLPYDASLCPLLTTSLLTGTQADGPPAIKGWNYSALKISSSGEFSDVVEDKAFVTLIDSGAPKGSGNLPANYAVVKVAPMTGMVSITRP